jgi:hypothetical protein
MVAPRNLYATIMVAEGVAIKADQIGPDEPRPTCGPEEFGDRD